jgi:hypothetical protein
MCILFSKDCRIYSDLCGFCVPFISMDMTFAVRSPCSPRSYQWYLVSVIVHYMFFICGYQLLTVQMKRTSVIMYVMSSYFVLYDLVKGIIGMVLYELLVSGWTWSFIQALRTSVDQLFILSIPAVALVMVCSHILYIVWYWQAEILHKQVLMHYEFKCSIWLHFIFYLSDLT